MLSSRWWRKNFGLLVDLAALVAAWIFTVFLMWLLLFNGWQKFSQFISVIIIYSGLLLFPLANVIWLHVRIAPRLVTLSSLAHREELAVTLISAHDHLAAQLKWPIIRALAPVCTAWPINAILVYGDLNDIPTLTVLLCSLSGVATVLTISLCGVFDFLTRQCRPEGGGGFSRLVILFVWSIIAIGMTGLLLLLLFLFFSLLHDLHLYSRLITSHRWIVNLLFCWPLGLLFPALCVVIAIKRWRKAVEVYYRFE